MVIQLDRKSTPQRAADVLREMILAGEIMAGTEVAERYVLELFGISRPTARDAIAELVHQGLLRKQANHSAYVPTFTTDDIAEIRKLLELFSPEAMAELSTPLGVDPVTSPRLRRAIDLLTTELRMAQLQNP